VKILNLSLLVLSSSLATPSVFSAEQKPDDRDVSAEAKGQLAQVYCACQVQARTTNTIQLVLNIAANIPIPSSQTCIAYCQAQAAPYLGPSGLTNRNNLAQGLCSAYSAYPPVSYNNWSIAVWSVPPGTWNTAQLGSLASTIGTLVDTPAVTSTTLTCPSGWVSNSSNQPSGVTTDALCKRGPVGTVTTSSPPPNGAVIGPSPQVWPPAWGFVWGGSIFEYGNAYNGGAAIKAPASPAVCKII
jgi:hypothetical protein